MRGTRGGIVRCYAELSELRKSIACKFTNSWSICWAQAVHWLWKIERPNILSSKLIIRNWLPPNAALAPENSSRGGSCKEDYKMMRGAKRDMLRQIQEARDRQIAPQQWKEATSVPSDDSGWMEFLIFPIKAQNNLWGLATWTERIERAEELKSTCINAINGTEHCTDSWTGLMNRMHWEEL